MYKTQKKTLIIAIIISYKILKRREFQRLNLFISLVICVTISRAKGGDPYGERKVFVPAKCASVPDFD